MGLWSSFTKSITALWSGPCSQSRHEDKVVEVKSRAPVKPEAPASDNPHSDPLPHSPEPPSTATLPQTPQVQNQDSTSDTKIFSPELMVAKAPELLTSKQAENSSDSKWPSKPTEIDKLALCKRIIQSNLPKEKKTEVDEFFRNFTANPLGVRGSIKFTNENGVNKINEIAMAMNGLNENFDDNFKNKVDEISKNLDNKEAFYHYMSLYPKSNTTSREASPNGSFSQELPLDSIPSEPYTPNGSMSPDGPSVFKLSFISPPPARGVGRAGG